MAEGNGELDPKVMLGMMMLKGKNGVKRNIVKAAEYLGDAAAVGNTKAMVNIGMMLMKGMGGRGNSNKVLQGGGCKGKRKC